MSWPVPIVTITITKNEDGWVVSDDAKNVFLSVWFECKKEAKEDADDREAYFLSTGAEVDRDDAF